MGVEPYPLRAPEPLPILNLSNFVPKNGFPVSCEGVNNPKWSEMGHFFFSIFALVSVYLSHVGFFFIRYEQFDFSP